MTLRRSFKWLAGGLLAAILLAVLFIAIYGWNWLRGPIERMATAKTGRALVINGDLSLKFGWPSPRFRADGVSFANPAWAKEKQMIAAEAVEITIDLPQLLARTLVFTDVRLERPVIFLEQGVDGRKNWLLDLEQQDEGARVRIDRLSLNHGLLGYDDAARKTRVRAEVSTASTPGESGLEFSAQGHYKGLPLKAHGKGGPVLGLRDATTPYPLQVDATVGRTGVKAAGSITSLLNLSAVDLRLALHGDSLADLFPLLGMAFPETRAYVTDGHLLHSDRTWRYEKFSGRIGGSDIAGSVRVTTGGKRPALQAELLSKHLDFADLGPVIGARPERVPAARKALAAKAQPVLLTAAKPTPASARLLPDLPFKIDRWNSVDAEVGLKAGSIRGAGALPLDDLVVHLSLRDSVLRLDPLDFGIAGGHLDAVISLDGSQDPIQAKARLRAKKLSLARLLPSAQLGKSGIGHLSGEFDLVGHGNSVGGMLASSSGKLGLVVSDGKISRLTMEKAGLHLWEILELKVTGDKLITLRCAIADFAVKDGTMHAEALIFDTEITTISGSGRIDLGRERLDLTFKQKTKNTSPLALRSPLRVHGSFDRPVVEVDKGRVAVRALGALGLGLVNPLLALLPLIDAGPGKDSDCGQLARAARAAAPPNSKRKVPRN